MEELESQIAKICLGNTKSSNAYVYASAEKAPVGEAELYVVAELPLFNPAAEEDCEAICLAIASGLKRAYRKPAAENSFENAISQINEELGKLASMGQTQWIDKLNCILAVKNGAAFDIATCGKVSAYLLRNHEFTDISCSQTKSHPLKTFENYASGKIRLGDLLLLSTTQLFNYLSMDRILQIIDSNDFLTATQTIIQLLKETADPQVSFGVLLNLQVPLGQTQDQDLDLENYAVEAGPEKQNILAAAIAYAKNAFGLDKAQKRKPQVALPKVSLSTKIKNFSGGAKNLMDKSKGVWQTARASAGAAGNAAKQAVKPDNFKNLSPQKKFFLASALILMVAVIANIFIAAHIKKSRAAESQITSQLTQSQSLLANAESSLLYKDYSTAASDLAQVKNILPDASKVDSAHKNLYTQLLAEYNTDQQEMQKVVNVQVQNLGALGQGNSLIKLPGYAAVMSGNAIISYNKQSAQIQDSQLSDGGTGILASSYISGNLAAIYDGTGLYVWDFSASKLSPGFSQNVPAKGDFGGMAYYPTNSRLYVLDKKNSQVVSFLAGKNSFSRPVVSFSDQALGTGIDMAIDGDVYVLTPTGINKYLAGRLQNFSIPQMPIAFSGSGKIYTEKDFNYIYVLDIGNNRILVIDKSGNLIYTLKSDQFTKLQDFQVDEANKVMYVLNDGSLLKVTLP